MLVIKLQREIKGGGYIAPLSRAGCGTLFCKGLEKGIVDFAGHVFSVKTIQLTVVW